MPDEKPPIENDAEKKKQFAKEQLQFLKDQGIEKPLRRSRIFKAAGPGQIQEAWKLAHCEDWTTPEGRVRKDLLDCILTGVRGSQDFGYERMKAVLQVTGFYVPETQSTRSFFRTLDGAMEILVPDSYEFDDEELIEIVKGLQRK